MLIEKANSARNKKTRERILLDLSLVSIKTMTAVSDTKKPYHQILHKRIADIDANYLVCITGR